MSEKRHTMIRNKLRALETRGLIDRWSWDEQGVRYLLWAPGDDSPSVHTLMATEAFLLGVDLADVEHMRRRPTFVADPEDGTAVRVRYDAELDRAS